MSSGAADHETAAREHYDVIVERLAQFAEDANELLLVDDPACVALDALVGLLRQTADWHHRAEQGWADAAARADKAEGLLRQTEQERRRVPSDDGGPGHEESYWLRAKLQASITHLRDVEDFYRLRGGLPDGFNTLRADRARDLYEAITEDFVDGKTTRPTRAELEQEVERLKRGNQERETP